MAKNFWNEYLQSLRLQMINLTIILNGDDLEHEQNDFVVCEVGVRHKIDNLTYLKTIGTIPVPRDLYDRMDTNFYGGVDNNEGEEYLWNNLNKILFYDRSQIR